MRVERKTYFPRVTSLVENPPQLSRANILFPMIFECRTTLVDESQWVLVVVLSNPLALLLVKLLESVVHRLATSLEVGFLAFGPGVEGTDRLTVKRCD